MSRYEFYVPPLRSWPRLWWNTYKAMVGWVTTPFRQKIPHISTWKD